MENDDYEANQEVAAEAFKVFVDGLEDRTVLVAANSHYTDESLANGDFDARPEKSYAVFAFSEKGYGFGEITIACDANGQMYIDTEASSPETVKRILSRIVDTAILDREDDPVRHKQFNTFMGRICSEACPVCHPKGKSE